LNSGRSLHLVITVVAAVVLFGSAAAVLRDSGSEEGWRFAGIEGFGLVLPACGVIGAVGVIWLGWSLFRVTASIASTVAWLDRGNRESAESCGHPAAKLLVESINSAFDRYAGEAVDSEKQLMDSQIQIQLAQRQQKNTEAIIYSMRDGVIVVINRLAILPGMLAGTLWTFSQASRRAKRGRRGVKSSSLYQRTMMPVPRQEYLIALSRVFSTTAVRFAVLRLFFTILPAKEKFLR